MPWAFANGEIRTFVSDNLRDDDESIIRFQADENGRFKVDCVPVGLVTVEFPFQVFDVIGSYNSSALVVKGETTVIQAFDPAKPSELRLAFMIGDGSPRQYQTGTGLSAARKVENVTVDRAPSAISRILGMGHREPMFRVDLVPVSKGQLSFADSDWTRLDARGKIVLPDVGDGTYRVRVFDWLGLVGLDSGPLFDREVVVAPGGGGEVRIRLDAGCITGKIPALNDNYWRPVEVTAIANGNRALPHRARCDDDGNFCVRYLSPGIYSLFIHDPNSGYCRVDQIAVLAGAVDIGERTLSRGATINGEIHFERTSRYPPRSSRSKPRRIDTPEVSRFFQLRLRQYYQFMARPLDRIGSHRRRHSRNARRGCHRDGHVPRGSLRGSPPGTMTERRDRKIAVVRGVEPFQSQRAFLARARYLPPLDVLAGA